MNKYYMKYGEGDIEFEYPEKNILKVILPNEFDESSLSQEEIIEESIIHPIACPRLSEIVKLGETVCVVVPDITRAWQLPQISVPAIIKELNYGGIEDKDILIISATGSHRAQTDSELSSLVSKEIFERIETINHDCRDRQNLKYVGTTSRGTVVELNKRAIESDHLVLVGGAVYHFIAGYGGGRKSILPGISGYNTIMMNHSYSLNTEKESGSNSNVKSGNLSETNPVHCDMMEAAKFVNPSFLLNVVVNSDKKIIHASSGDYIEAHEAACRVIDAIDGIKIDGKGEMVIASACGYPKDINLYQTSKTIFNAVESIEENGVMIVISECSEGLGNSEIEHIIKNFDNMSDREDDLRNDYSIGKGVGFLECEYAEKYHFILVSNIDNKELKNTNIKVVSRIQEAIELAYKIKGKKDIKTYIMPFGANTLPKY